jgi:acid stress-induced BolA-like protein IbaG/YrbA
MNAELESAIIAAIPDARVEVSVDGNRAVIQVVSEVFSGMSRVQKQQTVYGCIDGYIQDGRLHAVSIRALTPAEAG